MGTSDFHVLIAGGGLAGLCLAQGLSQAGVRCSVFESAATLTASHYRLQLHSDGGNALAHCLPRPLFDLYQLTSSITPKRMQAVILDPGGYELGARPPEGGKVDGPIPHTAAHHRMLGQILLTGLDNMVSFGQAVTAYRELADGVEVELSDQSRVRGDLLVGADGLGSAVRRQLLPHVEPVDTGTRAVYARTALTPELLRDVPEIVAESGAAISDPGRAFITFGCYRSRRPLAQALEESGAAALHPRVDAVDDYMMVGAQIGGIGSRPRTDEELFGSDGAGLKRILCEQLSEKWHPALQRLIEHVDPMSCSVTTLQTMQPPPPWTTGRVTLAGDAIHATLPTLNVGANMSLRDAHVLCEKITAVARGEQPFLDAVATYETDMRRRVTPILRSALKPPLSIRLLEAGLRFTRRFTGA